MLVQSLVSLFYKCSSNAVIVGWTTCARIAIRRCFRIRMKCAYLCDLDDPELSMQAIHCLPSLCSAGQLSVLNDVSCQVSVPAFFRALLLRLMPQRCHSLCLFLVQSYKGVLLLRLPNVMSTSAVRTLSFFSTLQQDSVQQGAVQRLWRI